MIKVTIVLCCLALASEAKSYNSLNDLQQFFNGPSVTGSTVTIEDASNDAVQQQPQQPLAAASSYDMQMPEYVQTRPSYQTSGGAQVAAAIQSKRTVEVKPISIQQEPVEPHVVDVEASYQPVQVVFRSSSSPVMVQQIHTPSAPMQLEATQSEDEPHRVQHQVMRPVIQEIREIIQPYRRVLQEIRPVLEEVRTVVAKAAGGNPAQVAPGTSIGLGGGAGGMAGGLGGGYGGGQGLGAPQGGPRYARSGYDAQASTQRASRSNQRKNYNRRSGAAVSPKRHQPQIQQYAARS